MLDQALKHGHNKFFIGICRGTQLMLEENLEDAPDGHRPDENIIWQKNNDVVETQMELTDDGEKADEFNLGGKASVGCNHHLGAATLPQRLREGGWRVAYVSSNPNEKGAKTIEMAIRRDKKGIITGVMFQNHPEKIDVAKDEKGVTIEELNKTANKIYAGIRQAIAVHQAEYILKKSDKLDQEVS
jgi:hypothetical protein